MKKILLAALFILPLFITVSVLNASEISWVSASSVLFTKKEHHKVTPGNPVPFSFLSTKQDCTEMQFTLDNSTSRDVCTVRIANGQVSNDEYVLLHGTTVARKLTSSSTKHSAFIPLRDSSKIIELKQISNKLVISIISDAYVLPSSQYGSAKYELPFMNKTEKIIQYANANIQPLSPNGVNVSKNGKWLVGEAGNGFFTYEIATDTFRYVKQAYKTSSITTAISNDGRYIITANKLGKFEITDTQQCESYSPQNGTSAKCSSINYFDSIKQYLPTLANDVELKKVQFDNNEQISFYATHDFVSNTEHMISKITMNLAGNTVRNYLALGDSFAAGEGAYNYRAGTDFADNRCHLSLDSYPYLLDDASLGSTQSIACSGAKTKDIDFNDQDSYNIDLKQSKNKEDPILYDTEIYNNYLPGYRVQLNFVDRKSPNIVTISIGGNDIGFSKIVQSCVVSAYDCFDYYEERAAIVSSINNTYDSLVDTYIKIKEESAKDAHIYVLGYPEIAKPDGDCAANVHLSNNEIKLGNDITNYLNSVIEMAANHAGVAYIDVTDALYGNRLCEIDSSKAAVNGLTAGDSAPIPEIGPLGSESFHPNKKGHEMYAEKIKQLTNNFNLQMPDIVQSNPNNTPLSDIPFVANAPIKGDTIFDTYYEDSMSEDVLYKDSTVAVQLNTDSFALRNDKEVRIELHSDPTLLGIVTPTSGTVNTTLSIPSNVEPGYHTLHIYATNIGNKVIDIQKIVYVAASETDYDGDGILNKGEACLVGETSGMDVDVDGVDDACDGFIDIAPTVVEEPSTPPIDVVDEQPEVISTDKELPLSESRPEWLLMKEREIAAEQAAANQSATITPTEENTTQQQPITTYPQQENTPEDSANDSTEQTPPSTQVAGVSSAIESKEQPTQQQSYWWLYLLVAGVVSLFGFGIYRYMTEENKV